MQSLVLKSLKSRSAVLLDKDSYRLLHVVVWLSLTGAAGVKHTAMTTKGVIVENLRIVKSATATNARVILFDTLQESRSTARTATNTGSLVVIPENEPATTITTGVPNMLRSRVVRTTEKEPV